DLARIRRELQNPLPLTLVPIAVPLLAVDAIVRDAVRALRKVAPKATGTLVDMLLDAEVDAQVRRRIPRVLKAAKSQRAADGLALALSDPVFEVRVQAALALVQLREDAKVSIDRDLVFDSAVAEVAER